METVFIYGLNDPLTGQCRYVGKSVNPRLRFLEHLRRAAKGVDRMHAHCWIRKLQQKGLRPKLEILDVVPASEWEFWEKEYIRVFRAICPSLTNISDGGDYAFSWKGKKMPAGAVEKRVAHLRGKPLSAAHRLAVSRGKKGQKPHPKTIAASIAPEVLKRRANTRKQNNKENLNKALEIIKSCFMLLHGTGSGAKLNYEYSSDCRGPLHTGASPVETSPLVGQAGRFDCAGKPRNSGLLDIPLRGNLASFQAV